MDNNELLLLSRVILGSRPAVPPVAGLSCDLSSCCCFGCGALLPHQSTMVELYSMHCSDQAPLAARLVTKVPRGRVKVQCWSSGGTGLGRIWD